MKSRINQTSFGFSVHICFVFKVPDFYKGESDTVDVYRMNLLILAGNIVFISLK